MGFVAAAVIFAGAAASIFRSEPKQRRYEPPPPQPDVHYYREGPRLKDLKVQFSSYGKAISLIYGTVRLAGNIIWSRPLKEDSAQTESRSGHAVTRTTDYTYKATCAIALCKGVITGVSRMWADSTLLDLSKLSHKLYLGDELQEPDPTIQSFEGVGKTPAYRGLAYIVIRDFPLAEYQNRIPNFTFEVRRHLPSPNALEDKITSITFGQGIGEYLYDTMVQEKAAGQRTNGQFVQAGVAQKLNLNNSNNKADSLVALDEMKSVLPKVEWVSLPVYWVMNIKDGSIKPGVDFRGQNSRVTPDEWRVANYTRDTAHLVPDGLSTPSDLSILRTAQALKSRGYKVMLYPKLLYYDSKKEVFTDDISSFWFLTSQHQAFITHYATLSIGGISLRDHIHAFVVASGGVVTHIVREANPDAKESSHVPYFKRLAAEARKSLPHAKLIFAAFSGLYHSYYKRYHLDELWSDPNIDVIGIECYFPLTESNGPPTREQVVAAWQSGEGWDYYYDLNHQRNIALTKQFAWKNIRHWHETYHINPDGKRTSWQPKMKPIWITELAFGSIDGCTNEPEVFSSPYSKRYPKGSNGRADFSSQRIALDGSLDYLNTQEFIEQKFVSFWDPRPYPYYPSLKDRWLQPNTWKKDASLQGKLGWMKLSTIVQDLLDEVDYKTCDARQLDDMVCGFVVSKRQSVRASLEQLATAYFFDAVEANGILTFTKRGAASCATIDSRDFIAQTDTDSFIITREQELDLPRSIDVTYINPDQFYETGIASAYRQTVKALSSVSINLPIVLSAQEAQRIADVTLLQEWITRTQYKFSLPPKYMRLKPTDVIMVEKYVEHSSQDPSQAATPDTRSGIVHTHYMRILATKLMPNGVQEISAVAEDTSSYEYYGERNETAPRFSLPHPTPKTRLVLLDLPAINAADGAHLSCAAVGETAGWRGAALYAAACGSEGSGICDDDCDYQGQILEQATMGTVVGCNLPSKFHAHEAWFAALEVASAATAAACLPPLQSGSYGVTGGSLSGESRRSFSGGGWDEHTTIDVMLLHGELFSTTEEGVLAGANLCVIDDEVLQFQKAEFVRDHHYRLSKLLRGRKGTEGLITAHNAGERFVLINSAIVKIPVPLACWGAPRQYKAVTFGERIHNTEAVEFTYNARALKPYAPCHVRAVRDENGDVTISWVRRTRLNGEWLSYVDAPVSEEAERYEVEVVISSEQPPVRRIITGLTLPSAVYTKAQQLEDFGEAQEIGFNVYQLSSLVGRGYPGTVVIKLPRHA